MGSAETAGGLDEATEDECDVVSSRAAMLKVMSVFEYARRRRTDRTQMALVAKVIMLLLNLLHCDERFEQLIPNDCN